MSSATMQQNPPAYVGRYTDGGKLVPLPLGNRELLRAREHAAAMLDTFDFGKRRYTLQISLLSYAATFLPFELACMDRGFIVCCCDDSPYEANRIESVLRRFEPAFAAGVTAQALDGLVAAGFDPAALFANHVVWAKADAHDRLVDVPGITLLRWIELGPALALECRHAWGAHYDDRDWVVEEDGGELLVSSRLDRVVALDRVRTGIRGTVDRTPCPCGHFGSRVVLAD